MYKFFCALVCAVPLVFPEAVFAEDTSLLSRAEHILQKVVEADMACRDVPLTLTPAPDPKNPGKMWFTERPALLCAYGEQSGTWHPVTIALPSPVPLQYFACIGDAPTTLDRRSCALLYRTLTPGYRLAHLGGTGVTRLSFDVWHEETGERLTVYRTRHLWLDDEALASRNFDRVVSTMRTVSYTPYHADLHDPALVIEGRGFLVNAVERALAAVSIVPSNAFSGRTLSETVPSEILVALAMIEQMDDKSFDESPLQTMEAVLVEYALNREHAYTWTQSTAMAIGPMQFTNLRGDGTYNAVVRKCPAAKLDPNFETGARELGNALKAATCLIDLEVAQFPRIAKLYERSPILAGIYPVAAYNGSPSSARALYEWIARRGIDIETDVVPIPKSLSIKRQEQCPCMMANGKVRKKGTRLVIKQNTETPGYVKKYIFIINYLGKE